MRWSTGAPLQPDAETARDLARRELAEQAYRDAEPGLLERAIAAVVDLLAGLGAPAGPSPLRTAAVVLLLLALAVAVVLALRAVGRGSRTSRRRADPVLGAAPLGAAEHRDAADAAAARGAWEEAVTERFRALVSALGERDLVALAPGLTAAEAAAQAGTALPEHAAALGRAGDLFSAVAYGGRSAGPADDDALRSLDADVARARPAPVGAA